MWAIFQLDTESGSWTKKSSFDQLDDCQREFETTKRSNINSYLLWDGDKEPETHKERSEIAETMLSLNEGGVKRVYTDAVISMAPANKCPSCCGGCICVHEYGSIKPHCEAIYEIGPDGTWVIIVTCYTSCGGDPP